MPTKITVDYTDVSKTLEVLKGLRPAMLVGIAHSLFQMGKRSFERQESPESAKWTPLSGRYELLKQKLFPGRNILYRSGMLFRTLFEAVEGNRAMVGSRLPYSAIHQYGGKAGRGHKATIPARPFLPSVETAEKEAVRLAQEILQAAIDGAEQK